MTLYLCGMAALDVLRHLRSTNDGLVPGKVPRPRRLRGAIHTSKELNALNDDAQRVLSHVRGKVEALVPSSDRLTHTSRLTTRLWSGDLPHGAFIDIGNNVCLSSPQFLFLQLAPVLSEIELIKLGLELCGFYSCWSLPSLTGGKQQDSSDTTYGLMPVTSLSKLSTFVEHRKNTRGAVNARKALRWVLNNSASPAETAVYLLLCLPRHRGGFGMPKPVFNARVRVTTSTTHQNRYPDLYWQAHSLDVEYQSDYAHTGNWKRYRDSQREVELEAEKITVLPLTRLQLENVDDFEAFAASVRRNLGRRARPTPDGWRPKHLELREALLS